MSSESEEAFFKQALGFAEGEDVELYLVDSRNDEARHVGQFRQDFSKNELRLYQQKELFLDSPETRSIYFGQKDRPPHIVKLTRAASNEYRGELETEKFIALIEMKLYSPYEKERFILTAEIRKNAKRAESVLPKGWQQSRE